MASDDWSWRRRFHSVAPSDLPSELRPDLRAVERPEVQTSELAIAFLLDGYAERDRDALAPAVDAALRQVEFPSEARLKASAVKEGDPLLHNLSMAQPYCLGSVKPDFFSGSVFRSIHTSLMTANKTFGFGARLKAARLAKNMTGEELGKGCGVDGRDASKASISDWEHERHYPKADQIRIICLRLNISPDHLIFGDIQADEKVTAAASAVEALTEDQRRKLFTQMLPTPNRERLQETHASVPAQQPKLRASRKAT